MGDGLTEARTPNQPRHPGEGRDLDLSQERTGEIPAFAGMTEGGKTTQFSHSPLASGDILHH